MTIASVTESLKEGAERVSEGRIRIDAKKALEKLRDHRLADPHHYVLELLRAAVAYGASKVEVRADADDFELRFDGDAPSAPVVRDLLSHALTGGKDRQAIAARLLALGVAGALGLKPSHVRVVASGMGFEVRPPVEVEIGEKRVGSGGTLVQVKERVSWRVLRDALAGPTELEVIRKAVRHFPAKLSLNGKPWVRESLFPEPVLAQVERTVGEARLVAAVPSLRARASTLALEVFGVGVCTRTLELPLLQVTAWARDDGLRRNASGSDVVDGDGRLEKLLKALPQLAEELLGELVSSLLKKESAEIRALLTDLALYAAWKKKLPKLPSSLRAVLEQAPLLPGPGGEWVSVAELSAEERAGRPLRFSRCRFPAGSYTRPAILLEGDGRRYESLLPRPPTLDVATEVAARRQAAERRLTWEASPFEAATLPGKTYLARASLEHEDLVGEVAFPQASMRPAVRLLALGRLVQQTEPFELEPLQLQAVVNLPRPLSEKAWAAFPVPLTFGKTSEALRDAAVRALCAALNEAPAPDARLYEHARDLVVHLVRHHRLKQLASLPAALRQVPIFEAAGGGFASLEALGGDEVCRYISRRWPHPSLSGYPVVVLKEPELRALEQLFGAERLKSHVETLAREAEVRASHAGRAEEPRLKVATAVRVKLEEAGLKGEVGIPQANGSGLSLKLLRQGFALEQCTLPARYEQAVAVIESPELKPDEKWRHAQRDEVYSRVLAAVRSAERRLAGELLTRIRGLSLDRLSDGPRGFLLAFLRKELAGFPRKADLDGLLQDAIHAPLFLASTGPVSLAQISEALGAGGKLWVLPSPLPRDLPAGVFVVEADLSVSRVLADVFELRALEATPEIARARAMIAFQEKPKRTLTLPGNIALRTTVIELPQMRGVVGFDPPLSRGAEVELLYQERLLRALTFPNALPVRAVLEVDEVPLDIADPGLDGALEPLVRSAIDRAEVALVEAALQDPAAPYSPHLLLAALGSRLDRKLPKELARRLLGHEAVPCTDKKYRPASAFEQMDRVQYVTEDIRGVPRSGELIVIASTPWLMHAVGRWSAISVDVTGSFKAELEARRRLEAQPQLEKVEVSAPALRRRPLSAAGIEGEVALVAGVGGHLTLLHGRRLLGRVSEPRLPPGIEAAANCDALTPKPSHTDAVRDRAYEDLVGVCARATRELISQIVTEFGALPEPEKATLTPVLARLGLWFLASKRPPSRLLELPLLETTEGGPLRLRQLLSELHKQKRVRHSASTGSLLSASAWVWRPRPGELELAAGGPLKLVDATPELARAEKVRSRPKLDSLQAPLESAWREPLTGGGVEGEVAIGATGPSKRLVIQVLHQRSLLETLDLEHPIGAVVRANCDALKPVASWTKARRDQAFRDAREAIEQALERLVTKLLASGQSEPGWRAYAVAATGWKLESTGPLASQLPGLELFVDSGGRPVTLGEVLAQVSRYGRVAMAEAGLAPSSGFEGVVLRASEPEQALLGELELKYEDVSQDLRRELDLEASRNSRRLAVLKYPKQALARLEVHSGGFKGELALPSEDGPDTRLTLARAGVAVEGFDDGGIGLAGVLDHPELPVNGEWTEACPTPEMRRAIAEQIEALFGQLAVGSERLFSAQRCRAARFVLRFLRSRGTAAPAHLDALPPASWGVASAKLFWTCDGRWVDLRAIAARVLRRGSVWVVDSPISADEVKGDVVLAAVALGEGGCEDLEEVLGRGSVCSRPLEQWRLEREEEDPEEHTPLGQGLLTLRREARLLRDGSLGRLSAKELKQIKLQRGRGKIPIRYDEERKLALLDPEHPLIERALRESATRPDRLYVLLTAIYGAVNRALERVTDEDEQRLVSGLIGHLAANSDLLNGPSGPLES